MLLILILHVLLLLAALLYIVPAVTDGGVAIRRSSAVRGVMALIAIALTNKIFWHLTVLLGVHSTISSTLLTLGLIGWLANTLAIFLTGRIMPGVLYVRSFATAAGASLVLILAGWVIAFFLL